MKWIRKYKLFKEAQESQSQFEEKPKSIYKPNNLISEICISMILLNNEFLDRILDGGAKSRYNENSQVFLTDLKNLLLSKNRLKLGKFINEKCVEDNETSKVNQIFESIKFDIEKDWNKLVNARTEARNIIDKVLVGEKLTENLIKCIYWVGPNQVKDYNEDIVIELEDGRQLSFFLNKNLSMSKSASFNTFADDLIGQETDKIFGEEYIGKWNKLAQDWIKIIYENANKNIQVHIEKYLDRTRVDSIGYFEFLDSKHKDPRFRNLGEYIKEFDKNVIYLSDLLGLIWKNREICFMDSERIYKEWMEKKIYILNSKILEHLFTESLVKNNKDDIKKVENNFKLADGVVKMKLMKTFVEKLNCLERPIYYLGNNGNSFHQVPSRKFFRDHYNNMKIKFDYHVKMIVNNEEEENNDFIIKLELELDNKLLMNCDISVRFTGNEMSGKLGARYKFEPVDNFNNIITNKNKVFSDED